jgi:YggT family protein
VSPLALIRVVFEVLYVLLIARVVISWIPGVDVSHPAVRVIYRVTAPILDPIRRIIPPIGGLDFSPWIAILLLSLVQRVVLD